MTKWKDATVIIDWVSVDLYKIKPGETVYSSTTTTPATTDYSTSVTIWKRELEAATKRADKWWNDWYYGQVEDEVLRVTIVEWDDPNWIAIYVDGDKKWEGRVMSLEELCTVCGSKTLKLTRKRANYHGHKALEEDGAAPPRLEDVK